jgi:hypothetical protein
MRTPERLTYRKTYLIEEGEYGAVLASLAATRTQAIEEGYTDFTIGLEDRSEYAEDGCDLAIKASRLETDKEYADRMEYSRQSSERTKAAWAARKAKK